MNTLEKDVKRMEMQIEQLISYRRQSEQSPESN